MLAFEEGEYLSRTISTGSPAANLYWLKRYEPENFERIGKFLIGPDYLTYRLTGSSCTDYCGASTSCLYENEKREDLLYSVLEGLCFGFRELSEKMNLSVQENGSVKVVGGGAKSRVWMQTMANVLNLPVEQMDGMIGAAFGVALLAAYQDGGGTDYRRVTEKTVSVRRRFVP